MGVSYRTTHREQVRAADRDGGPVLRLGTQFDLQLHERFNILTGPHVASIYTMPQYAHAEPGGDEGAIGVTALELLGNLCSRVLPTLPAMTMLPDPGV